MLVEVNYLAVLVATIVAFGIGSAWYSPLLFIKPWLHSRGLEYTAEMSSGKKMPMGNMAIEFITTLIIAFFIAEFATWLGIGNVADGLLLGFWIWLGFYATTLVGPVLWEKSTVKHYAITAGRWFVAIEAMSAIIGAWR